MSRQTLEKTLLFVLYLLAALALFHYNIQQSTVETQFEALARSFLHGHLYLSINDGRWLDGSYYKGYTYWPQGGFPAIVMLPFIAIFDGLIHQGHIQICVNILNSFLLYKIALKITKNKTTSLWLSFGYMFSTVYLVIGLIPWAGWFAQVIATSTLLLALFEYLHQKRWALIGLYLACGLATRIDLFIAAFFFVSSIIMAKQTRNQKIQQLLLLCTPILAGIVIVLLYNHFRFGSMLEFGYTYHIPELVIARATLKAHGTWSLFYYPTNFYYLFLKGFNQIVISGTKYLVYPFISADIWGMSIFLTSPILIWCIVHIKNTIKQQHVKLALLTCLFMLLFLLGYFGVGARQYGYRYALDFSPFLFLVLSYSFSSGMSKAAKCIIIASFAFNYWLFPTIF